MNLPSEFFTFEHLKTLSGLSLAVYIIVTALRAVWPNMTTKTVAFVVSVVMTIFVAVVDNKFVWQDIPLMLANAALVFLVATGSSLIVDAFMRGPEIDETTASHREKPWWSVWN